MIVQNNATPWIFLALVVMGGCALIGMLLGGVGPLSNDVSLGKLQITQTQASIDANATQSAMEAEQAAQASSAQKTAVIEDLTARPYQQQAIYNEQASTAQAAQAAATLTAIADDALNQQFMAQATRTAVANQMTMEGIALDATAVAMEQSQASARSQTILYIVLVGAVAVAFTAWIVARAVVRATTARAEFMASQEKMLAEQRRLAAMRASLREKKDSPGPRYPLPESLIAKKPRDPDDLPTAE